MNFNQLKEVADGILADRNLPEKVTRISIDHNFLTHEDEYVLSSCGISGFGSSLQESAEALADNLTPHNATCR